MEIEIEQKGSRTLSEQDIDFLREKPELNIEANHTFPFYPKKFKYLVSNNVFIDKSLFIK
jgi:hypothetical protein